MNKTNEFPPGWDEQRVQRLLTHYEQQSEDEAVAEDEAALEDDAEAFIKVPRELVPEIHKLIARHRAG